MSASQDACQITRTLLEKLGFHPEVRVCEGDEHTIEIDSAHNALLLGKNGERLDDLQYLVNRIVRKNHPEAGRFRLECDGYRKQKEGEIEEKALRLAEQAKATGREIWMARMNSYQRRLVHNALLEDPEVESLSEETSARLKKILIRPLVGVGE